MRTTGSINVLHIGSGKFTGRHHWVQGFPACSSELSRAVQELLDNDALCRRFATAAKVRGAREFSIETVKHRILRIYFDLLARELACEEPLAMVTE
jgi:glycosyltransferase involved in cell wall biosynthesis